MLKHYSLHKCYFHPDHIIVKFCTNVQCTLPLCQKCVPIHEKQHKDQQKNLSKAQILQYQKASQTALKKIENILTKRKQQKKIVNKKLKQLKDQVIEQVNKQFRYAQQQLNFQQLEQLQQKWNKIKRGSIKNLIYFYAGEYDHYFKADFQSNFQQKIMKSMVQLFTKVKNYISELQSSKNIKSITTSSNRNTQNNEENQKLGKLNIQKKLKTQNIDQGSAQKRYFSESTSKLGLNKKIKCQKNVVKQRQNCLSLLDLRQGKYLNDLSSQQFTFKKNVEQIKIQKQPCLDNLNVQLIPTHNQLSSKRNSIFSTIKGQNKKEQNLFNIKSIKSKYLNQVSISSKQCTDTKSIDQTSSIKKNRIMSNQEIRKSIQARIRKRHEQINSPLKQNNEKQNFSSIKKEKSLIQNNFLNQKTIFKQKKRHFEQFNIKDSCKQNIQVSVHNLQKANSQKSLNNSKVNSRFKKYDYLKELSSNLQNSNVVKTNKQKQILKQEAN